jgi:four helix bundle protein
MSRRCAFKLEIRSSKSETISNAPGSKPETVRPRRSYVHLAKACRAFIKSLSKTIGNIEDARQLIRSSGSVGANYIEANEALSKKDFILRIKICRKEAKESRCWFRLLEVAEKAGRERDLLIQEAQKLMNIFGAIIRKSE